MQDVIQQLKQENEFLQKQLQQQQQHGAAGADQRSTPQANGPAGPVNNNSRVSTSSRGLSSPRGGVLELNVSGKSLTTSLAALQQVRDGPGCQMLLLAAMHLYCCWCSCAVLCCISSQRTALLCPDMLCCAGAQQQAGDDV
jgi:hypothetical protein